LDEKFKQSFAYGTQMLDQQNSALPVLGIRISPSHFTVDVFFRVKNRSGLDNQYICFPLISEVTTTMSQLHALLVLITFWFRKFIPQLIVDTMSSTSDINFTANTNVLESSGFVFKRFRPVSGKTDRYFFNCIPGTQVVLNLQPRDVKLIRYPKVEGTHNPTSLMHLVSLLRAVVELHSVHKIVHGDIRFANVVFSVRIDCACGF
jgi:hypothetical protein